MNSLYSTLDLPHNKMSDRRPNAAGGTPGRVLGLVAQRRYQSVAGSPGPRRDGPCEQSVRGKGREKSGKGGKTKGKTGTDGRKGKEDQLPCFVVHPQ